jgi:hypothetical protein
VKGFGQLAQNCFWLLRKVDPISRSMAIGLKSQGSRSLSVSAPRRPSVSAYGLIRRGCSPANLANARYAMAACAAWRAWPTADGGRLAQQTRLAGEAIKPGQGAGASSPAAPLQPLPGASPPAGSDQATEQETAC